MGIVVGALLTWMSSLQLSVPPSYCGYPDGCSTVPITVPLLIMGVPTLAFSSLVLGLSLFQSRNSTILSPLVSEKAMPTEQAAPSAIRGATLYLLVAGVLALLLSPFLPWTPVNQFTGDGLSLILSASASVQPAGFLMLAFYFAGLVASIAVTLAFRKPVSYQGVVTALFPLYACFIYFVAWSAANFHGEPAMLTPGILVALLGSVLLEVSYLSYHRGVASTASDSK